MRVHEIINKNSASAPIFFHSNLFETSPIGAARFISANRIGRENWTSRILWNVIKCYSRVYLTSFFDWRRKIFTALRLALINFSAPIGLVWNERRTKLFIPANRSKNLSPPIRLALQNFSAPIGEVSIKFEWKIIGAEALFSLTTSCTRICWR